jgi:hypothetical protein
MKTLFLLIVLTQNGAGDINVSFVNTETLQQCQQKASMLESVFKSSSIPVIVNRCIESDLQFSEFGHASTASKIRNFYLIKVDEQSLQISMMPGWATCMHRQLNKEKQATVYCGSSIQSSIQSSI